MSTLAWAAADSTPPQQVPAEVEAPVSEAALRPGSRHGQVGLLRVVAGDFSRAGTLTLGAHAGFSRTSGLNIPGAMDTYASGLLALEWTPAGVPAFNRPGGPLGFALSVSMGAAADANSATTPRTIYSVGDMRLDARVGVRAGLVDFAVDGFLLVPSRVDRVGPEGRALTPGVLLAATLPLRRLSDSLAGRLHANVGYQDGNTEELLAGYSGSVAAYTFGVSRFAAVPVALGVEWPLALGAGSLTPFVEYSREQPLGVAAGRATPQRVTPGLRYSPFEGLAFDAAVDVGLSRGRVEGLAPVAPWQATLGLSYALWPPRTVYRERRVEVRVAAPPPEGRVRGSVRAHGSGEPLGRAVVSFPPSTGVPPTVTDAEGRFVSPPLPPGEHEVALALEGYEAARVRLSVPPSGEVPLDVGLKALPQPIKRGTVRGRAVDLDDKPVAIRIEFPSTPEGARGGQPFAEGTYEMKLPAGRHHMVVSADGYLSQGFSFEMEGGDRVIRDFVMRPLPKKPGASLTREKIEINQQLHFAFNKARLLKASFPLLDEVASILLSHPEVTRLRIEGHTDDIGDHAYNQGLSEARADAVLDYLMSKGVEFERLETVGYGKTRPLGPNATARGRAKNRRVEFVIVEP